MRTTSRPTSSSRRPSRPYGEPTDVDSETYFERLFTSLEQCKSELYRRAFEDVLETADLEASVVDTDAIRVAE